MMKKLRNLPESLEGKRIKYEAICGFDWRLIDKDVAKLLKNKNFKNPRIAWDGSVRNQYKIKDTIDILTNTGYRAQDIAVFMLVNHEISFKECVEKMDLLKIWGVRIADCCFDGGYRNAVPEYWSAKEIKEFRRRSRKHNQLVRFGIDPEIDPLNDDQRSLGDNYE